MNIELLQKARARVSNVPLLINMVSKRVKQLIAGFPPYVKPSGPDEEKIDIALREIAEGKLIAEMDFSPQPAGVAREEIPDTGWRIESESHRETASPLAGADFDTTE